MQIKYYKATDVGGRLGCRVTRCLKEGNDAIKEDKILVPLSLAFPTDNGMFAYSQIKP